MTPALPAEPGATWTGRGYTWTAYADDLIRAHFPTGGAEACHALLPHRTPGAIVRRADRLDVRHNARRNPHSPQSTAGDPSAPEPDSHLIWMEVDRVIRGAAVGVLGPRLVA